MGIHNYAVIYARAKKRVEKAPISDKNKLLELNQKRKQFTKLIDNQKTSTILYYFWEIVRILGSSGSLILYKGIQKESFNNH